MFSFLCLIVNLNLTHNPVINQKNNARVVNICASTSNSIFDDISKFSLVIGLGGFASYSERSSVQKSILPVLMGLEYNIDDSYFLQFIFARDAFIQSKYSQQDLQRVRTIFYGIKGAYQFLPFLNSFLNTSFSAESNKVYLFLYPSFVGSKSSMYYGGSRHEPSSYSNRFMIGYGVGYSLSITERTSAFMEVGNLPFGGLSFGVSMNLQ